MIYNFFKALALPPGDILAVLAVGLLLLVYHRRRAGLAVITTGLVLFYLLATPLVSGLLLRAAEGAPATDAALAASGAEAIIVLAGGFTRYAPEYGGPTVDGVTLVRLRYAAHLSRALNLPILVSGGQPDDTPVPLALLMKTALEQDFGVDVKWVEDRSDDTYQNAAYSAPILKAAGIHTALLVTHAAHMARSVRVFTQAGLKVIPAPTVFASREDMFKPDIAPRMSAFQDSYYAFYELIGDVWYGIRH
jgi:uncharacterized SAM-binding protein YcdF (DUF218 family)